MEIYVTCPKDLSSEIYNEIERNLSESGCKVYLNSPDDYSHADGMTTVADFVIAIIQGNIGNWFIGPALFEVLKHSVLSLRKNLKKGKGENVKRSIYLQIQGNDNKEVQIEISGDISDETIEKTIAQAFEYADGEKREKTFCNPAFVGTGMYADIPIAIIRYNKKKGKWEPNDFAAGKKYWDDKLKEAQNKWSE
jgi:hypothetical protein